MNRLKELREEKNLLQKEVASYLNVTTVCLSYYEKDKRKIPDDIKIKLCEYFNCSIEYLMGLSNEREKPSKDIFISAYDSEDIDEEDKQLLLNLYNKLKKKR